MNSLALARCKWLVKSFGCDVVLFAKSRRPWVPSFLEWCRDRGIITVCWLWDLYWGYRPDRPEQFHADLLFTTDGGHEKEFAKNGHNHAVLRQGIHKPEHVAYPQDYAHDVAFVGSATKTGHRHKLLSWLNDNYRNRFIHHTDTRGLELNKALARVKVVVGDSYASPHYWSNRIYEITGRGGFLLHPRTVGLNEEFTEGKHYIGYQGGRCDHDLRDLIEFWLAHNEERRIIQRQGFAYCGKHYTYEYRVASLLSQIKDYRRARKVAYKHPR
jgi:hypothetical protein